MFQDLSDIGIAVELMHIQPAGRSFDSSLFYQVSTYRKETNSKTERSSEIQQHI